MYTAGNKIIQCENHAQSCLFWLLVPSIWYSSNWNGDHHCETDHPRLIGSLPQHSQGGSPHEAGDGDDDGNGDDWNGDDYDGEDD